ncbi:MAG TPA: SOS response-associated peptidase [Verrucomicrobiota bacterium]|nr:hypothetical protein [Verrucomicrobiales bacterium]HRI14223.1 SOS response-associated peptidase [Verrucomicrobiota bacterium]
MCGRYRLVEDGQLKFEELSDVRIELRAFTPRFNLSPGQTAPVIRLQEGNLGVATLRWGLIPVWSKDPRIAFQCINARSETVATKPAFRSAFKCRRCLIPADGFYEWERTDGQKLPWCFVKSDKSPFVFAGLWETWSPSEGVPLVETFTICTTTPNRDTADIHDRMPVILAMKAAEVWLDPEAKPDALSSVLKPAPDGMLTRYRVSTVVNSSRNETPECIKPLEPQKAA